MAKMTLKAQLEAARAENEQLRSLLAAEIALREQWETECRRAKRDLVRLRFAQANPVEAAPTLGQLAAKYCAAHGVKSCTAAQAKTMATA